MEVAKQNATYWSKNLLHVFIVPYGGKKSMRVWWWDGLLACYRPKYTQNCLLCQNLPLILQIRPQIHHYTSFEHNVGSHDPCQLFWRPFWILQKCSFWPETPFGEEMRQFQWNFSFPSTFGSHFDQEILIWGCQYINKKCLGDQDLSLWVKNRKNFRGQPFWILQKMLLLTWNTFWWRDEAISMKFLVFEHLWQPFWPGNIDLRVPIYQQKMFGGPRSIIMSEKQKKNSEGGHFGFYKKCSFWPETPFGEETRQFWWNFWFPSTFGSHFDQEILIWGCQYINKKCLGDNFDEIFGFKIYHYERKTEKKFPGRPFWILQKCSFWPETPFGKETKQFWWNFWFPSTYGGHFDQNIVLRVPIYNNIDEIIDFWAPMAAFVSNSKHHLACKHFDQHIPHIYLIPNTTLLVNILTNIFPISTSIQRDQLRIWLLHSELTLFQLGTDHKHGNNTNETGQQYFQDWRKNMATNNKPWANVLRKTHMNG